LKIFEKFLSMIYEFFQLILVIFDCVDVVVVVVVADDGDDVVVVV